MSFHRRKWLPFCITAALASGPVAAVGLGDLRLQSSLGAPLQIEVPLSHIGDLTADQLKVQIGSADDYNALGVEFNYVHTQFKIEPIIKNGQTYVRITTREPITEPYLDFVLNLRWPQGQVVREFTVLLDPAPASVIHSTVSETPAASANLSAEPVAIATPVHRKREHRAQPQSFSQRQSLPSSQSVGGTYFTQRGDSLWLIANKSRPSANVSVEQVMVAIHAANPAAFIKGDAARLKEAATIVLPTAEQIAALNSVAPNSATPISSATTPASAMLSVGGAPVAATAEVAVAAPELAAENAALKAQVSDLTNNVANLSQNLAQSEERLHQMEVQLDSVLQQFQHLRAEQNVSAERGSAASSSSGSMISQVSAADFAPAPKAHTPWWVHLLYWLGIGSMAGWAVREHFWPLRRLAPANALGSGTAERVAAPAPASSSWVSPEENERYWHRDDAEAKLIVDSEEPASSLEHESIVLADAPELVTGPTDPVDASISAGVFAAFGRFDEAERLLQEALQHAPDRVDLKLQLLDIYLQADKPEAFVTLANAIEREPSATADNLAELAVLRDTYRSRY